MSREEEVSPLLATWRDSIIYFILIDRFRNGDRSNDDFGRNEFDSSNDDCFQGGDLVGIIEKLPYIRKMGFDAIWITPPVHGQWINPGTSCRGYHGYWAYDFTSVDPHFGTLEDYKRLVGEAHRLGLRVIQDIVVNHTGNYFTVDADAYDPKDPTKGYKLYPSEGATAPNDPVFRMNDPRRAEDRKAGVYNFTPNIRDYMDREQTLRYTLADLDDIDVTAPLAAARLREIYRFWIEEVGIDGFRIDTVFYTPEDFYEDFLHSKNPRDLGVKELAAQLGKPDFFVFGEAWSYDVRAINSYVRSGRKRRMDSAIDFPLNDALTKVFFKKAPTVELEKALALERENAPLWVNFLDNHDVERIASRGDERSVRQSLLALLTLPGLPCVYYGTECGFRELRKNMFDDSCYKGASATAKYLKRCLRLRRTHPVFNSGQFSFVKTSHASGLLTYQARSPEETMLVVFNTSDEKRLLEFPLENAAYECVFGSREGETTTGHVLVAAGDALVFRERVARGRARASSQRQKLPRLKVPAGPVKGEIEVKFRKTEATRPGKVFLLVDDDYEQKIEIPAPDKGHFSLQTERLGNGKHELTLLAEVRRGRWQTSRGAVIDVRNPYRSLVRVKLSPGEARSIAPGILAPADPSYQDQMLIEEAALSTSGRDLKLSLRMKDVTNGWNAPNGFDHVYFSVHFDCPNRPGRPYLPKLRYVPPGFRFDSGFLIYGWGAVAFGAKGATKEEFGEPLASPIESRVSLKPRRVEFVFPRELFVDLESFSGLKVFVSTWDGYLGNFHRVSAPAPAKREDWAFQAPRGADPEQVPRVYSSVFLEVPDSI